jgi:hypothetical protein
MKQFPFKWKHYKITKEIWSSHPKSKKTFYHQVGKAMFKARCQKCKYHTKGLPEGPGRQLPFQDRERCKG